MTKILAIYLRLLLLVCSATVSVAYAQSSEPSNNDSYPEHWHSFTQQEPVFDGTLHIVETGVQHKESLLLVHGLGNSGLNDWRSTIAVLEEHFHVISFDLPGFAKSAAKKGLFSPSNYSRLLHWITLNYAKNEKVTVIGHSLGGAVSLRYAHDYPKDINKLILVDAAGILYRTIFAKHITRLTSQSDSGFFDSVVNRVTRQIDALSESILSTADDVPDLMPLILHNDLVREALLKDKSGANAAMALISEDFSKAIDEVAIPTHIIWGSDDGVAPLRTGKLLAGRMQNATLSVLSGVGHVPMKESPTEFNQILLQDLLHNKLGETIAQVERKKTSKDYQCTDKYGVVVTGAYRSINLKGCNHATLKDVYAQSLTMESSKAILENVVIESPDVAIQTSDSVIEGTLVALVAPLPIKAAQSRIDLAGTSLITPGNKAMELDMSKVYFSVSDITKSKLKQYMHDIVSNP